MIFYNDLRPFNAEVQERIFNPIRSLKLSLLLGL